MEFPKIIAHRGFSSVAPENTMAAFKAAVDLNIDGIETDVQMSKDGHLILCHDETLDRTTNGHGLIKDHTLEQLRALSAGAWFGPQFTQEKIPTLRELLDLVSDKDLLINLEIKSGIVLYPQIEEQIIAMIHEYQIGHKVILSNFNHYSLLTCKAIDSSIRTGVLYECGLVDPWEYAEKLGADTLHPFLYNITPHLMAGAQDHHLPVIPFTVDSPAQMKQMIDLSVDGMFTNYPDRLLELKISHS